MSRIIALAKRHPNLIAYLLVLSTAVAAVVGIQNEAGVRRGEDERHLEQLTQEVCKAVNQSQGTLADLLRAILESDTDDVGPSPLTSGPEFEALDPETQAWARALAASLRETPDGGVEGVLRAFLDERLTPAQCDDRGRVR